MRSCRLWREPPAGGVLEWSTCLGPVLGKALGGSAQVGLTSTGRRSSFSSLNEAPVFADHRRTAAYCVRDQALAGEAAEERGETRILGEQLLEVGTPDREAANVGLRAHTRGAVDVVAE
jgi:hypothetical protein